VPNRRPLHASEALAGELAVVLARIVALEDRVREVARTIPGRIVFSTSVGLEDQAVQHAIASAGAAVDVFTLDTGRLFPETLETLARTEQRYGMRIRVLAPDTHEIEALVARDGIAGYRVSRDARLACCEARKVRPLRRGLEGAAAWITGLRRGQSTGRADIPFAAWEETQGLVKVNPLADWTSTQLDAYIAANDVPVNPLHARGFPSIGCQPCTRAISAGEDIRAGRWWWENQDGKECGLHVRRPARAEVSA